jgi:hypothetical protein
LHRSACSARTVLSGAPTSMSCHTA